MFHKSALIGIVVWPLSKIKVKNHIVHFLMLGAFIVEIFIAPAIIQVAATLFGSYNTIQFTGAYACFLLYALIWFISSLLIRCDAPWNLYINCMYLAAAIQCLGLYHMNIGRVGYYFAFFECLLIPESIEKSTRSKFLKMVFMADVLCSVCCTSIKTQAGDIWESVRMFRSGNESRRKG